MTTTTVAAQRSTRIRTLLLTGAFTRPDSTVLLFVIVLALLGGRGVISSADYEYRNIFVVVAAALLGITFVLSIFSRTYILPTRVLVVNLSGVNSFARKDLVGISATTHQVGYAIWWHVDQIEFSVRGRTRPIIGGGSHVLPRHTRPLLAALRAELLPTPASAQVPAIRAATAPRLHRGRPYFIAGPGAGLSVDPHVDRRQYWALQPHDPRPSRISNLSGWGALHEAAILAQDGQLTLIGERDTALAVALQRETDTLSWDASLRATKRSMRGLRVSGHDYPALPAIEPIVLLHRGLALSLLRALGHDPMRGRRRSHARRLLARDLPVSRVITLLAAHRMELLHLRYDKTATPTAHPLRTEADLTRLRTELLSNISLMKQLINGDLDHHVEDPELGLLTLVSMLIVGQDGALAIVPSRVADPLPLLEVTAQLHRWRGRLHEPLTDLALYQDLLHGVLTPPTLWGHRYA